MARKVLVLGNSSWWNLALYSKYFTTRNTTPRPTVANMYSRKVLNRRRISEAQAITMVTDEVMSTMVLKVAIGTLRMLDPWGQVSEPTRIMMQVANRAPNSITSDARKSQMPSLPLVTPVSGRASVM